MPNLCMVDILGTELSKEEEEILKHPNVGAIILFSRNFKSPEQFIQLIKKIRTIRPDIIIATDHEGGIVQRFQRYGFRSLPAARVFGDVYDLNPEVGIKLAEQYGEIMAKDLFAYGINLSLAPVLDIHNIHSNAIGKLDRSFHHDPNVVGILAEAFIRGMNKAGMQAIGKHYPGHGSVISDSHVSKPSFDVSMELLQEKDLKPFASIIGKNLLAGVMPAHVTYTAVDADNPASFSKTWLQDILRDSLNFNGIVLSDCLSMSGADIGDINLRAQRALEAGCDMLIICHQPRDLLHEILQTITFAQSEESSERIGNFKAKVLQFSSIYENKVSPLLTHTIYSVKATVSKEEENNSSLNRTTSI